MIRTVLESRVLIRVIEDGTKMGGSDFYMPADSDSLPKAVIIKVAENITTVEEGDIVYYVAPRERGKVSHDGEEHFIVPISAIAAITEHYEVDDEELPF